MLRLEKDFISSVEEVEIQTILDERVMTITNAVPSKTGCVEELQFKTFARKITREKNPANTA